MPAGVGIVGYVVSQGEDTPGKRSVRRPLLISLAFYLGVLLSFTVLGVVAAYVGQVLAGWSGVFAIVSAVFALLAGLAMIFSPVLRRYVPKPKTSGRSLRGAFLFGVVYSVAIVTTSTGPLLLVLTAGAAIGRPAFGATLSLAYAVGRGLPFVLLGAFGESLMGWLARLGAVLRISEVVIGIGLVGLAVYFAWQGLIQ